MPSPLLAVHWYNPSSFFETAAKVMVSELWPCTKSSDIFSVFGVILYHVIIDSGLLDTLQFNHPGCLSTNELDTNTTLGESWKSKSCMYQFQNHAYVENGVNVLR